MYLLKYKTTPRPNTFKNVIYKEKRSLIILFYEYLFQHILFIPFFFKNKKNNLLAK